MIKIKFDLDVKNYHGGPQIRLYDKQKLLYEDRLSKKGAQIIELDLDIVLPTVLTIEHHGKNMRYDTKLVDGNIVDDKGFLIEKIQIDNFTLKNEIYHFKLKTEDGETISNSNYIGHNGRVIIDIDSENLAIWYYKMKKKLIQSSEAFDYEQFKSEIFQNDKREVSY